MLRRAVSPHDPADPPPTDDPLVIAEFADHHRELGEYLRDPWVLAPCGRAQQTRGVASRERIELGEGRPVGGEEVRLGLRSEHGLAEVPCVLLVGVRRVGLVAEDADLLGLEAEIDRGREDLDRPKAAPDDTKHDIF